MIINSCVWGSKAKSPPKVPHGSPQKQHLKFHVAIHVMKKSNGGLGIPQKPISNVSQVPPPPPKWGTCGGLFEVKGGLAQNQMGDLGYLKSQSQTYPKSPFPNKPSNKQQTKMGDLGYLKVTN